jgi:hypothetical protein
MKYKQTIIAISVHAEGVNPIFGEGVTHVRLNDEAGGYFIELQQSDDTSENGVVKFDPAEWDELNAAVKSLLDSVSIETNSTGIVM